MSREETQKQVAEWIDRDAIADAILDALEEEGIGVTSENAQKVWLDVLYTELPNALERSVDALAEKGEILYV
jgi:transcriptional regulator of NAD metabolism